MSSESKKVAKNDMENDILTFPKMLNVILIKLGYSEKVHTSWDLQGIGNNLLINKKCNLIKISVLAWILGGQHQT